MRLCKGWFKCRKVRMSLFRQPPHPYSGHFYVIDLARGLAAFAVLFYHYQFFYYLKSVVRELTPNEARTEPLYQWLFVLYDYGYAAVNLFWMISGFVFAAVYISRKVSTRDFVVRRFARLYPLHFLTLCVVAVLQAISMRMTGQFQIYPMNDVYHFILNLFFASFWGLQKGPSFNAPIWSVSVEVLVYGLFWIMRPYIFRYGLIGPALLAVIAWFLAFHTPGHLPLLRQCVFYFFTGSAIFIAYAQWKARPKLLASVAVCVGVSGAISIMVLPTQFLSIGIPLLLVAILLICCALEAASFGDHIHGLRWFGDATYGMYLWHIPTQIITLLVFSRVEGARSVITQPWFLAAFLLTVITLARLSFVFFEDPARARLNRFAKPRRPPTPSIAPS